MRYRAAYFERFPGIWAHGDFAELTPSGGIIIHGRSDAVLNPGGVRIGTAEIYRQVEKLDEVLESIAIGQQWEDDVRVVLFVDVSKAWEQPGKMLFPVRAVGHARNSFSVEGPGLVLSIHCRPGPSMEAQGPRTTSPHALSARTTRYDRLVQPPAYFSLPRHLPCMCALQYPHAKCSCMLHANAMAAAPLLLACLSRCTCVRDAVARGWDEC